MKKLLLLTLLVVRCVFGNTDVMDEENVIDTTMSKGYWSHGSSLGFMSEKLPMSFINFSLFYNAGEYSEYYSDLSYMIFGLGVGIGAKYYYSNRLRSSPFLGTSIHVSFVGDEQIIEGLSFSLGLSLYDNNNTINNIISSLSKSKIKIPPHISKKRKYKTYLNIGASITYGDFPESPYLFPFINIEKKF